MSFNPRKLILPTMFLIVIIVAVYIFSRFEYGDIISSDMVKIKQTLMFWEKTGNEISDDFNKKKAKVDKKTAVLDKMDMNYEKEEE